MKISLVTNNMRISDKLRFRHHILSLMLGLPVVLLGACIYIYIYTNTHTHYKKVCIFAQ